ncbi:hypothetical protein [Mesorhizobium sp. CN2-181]|uniref:hypothetical protein n=1 Tax=Mesorhizobium yinganensis TaxID=3157707 RepID=UPI0032B7C21A
MLADVLNATIWRCRVAIRLAHAPTFAGHGLADANYRPSGLPYVSVVGPLNLEVEPDRDLPNNAFIFAQTPGYLAGVGGMAARQVPNGGQLHLTLDGDAEITVPVNFGVDAGASFADPVARRVARVVTAAIAARVAAGDARVNGQQVTDPDRLVDLARAALRWESGRQRFLLISGRRAVIGQAERLAGTAPSSAAVRTGPQDLSASLGLRGDSVLTVPSRIARHRVSQPTAVAVDLRLDLWAGTQQHLAEMLERWAMLTPTRGLLLTCPGMLRDDLARGAVDLRLATGVWPAETWTLAIMDAAAGFEDRISGRAPDLANGAALVGGRLVLGANATATMSVWDAPALPPPDRPDHPAPSGYALTVELQTDGAPQNGETVRVASLATDAGEALSLTLMTRSRAGRDETVLQIRAAHTTGNFAPRDFLMAPAQLAAGVSIHAVLEAPSGRISAYADGVALPLDDAAPPAARIEGVPLGDEDMPLTFGRAGNDREIRILRAELLGRPLGPVDPRLALTGATAARWAVGDPIGIASSYDAREATETFNAVVIAVEGDRLVLDRPLPRRFGRARSVVYKRSLFFAQRQWRRSDDLMNRMFRLSAEYRVSAFLDDRLPSTTAPIVESTDVQLRDMARTLAAQRAAAEGEEPPPPALPPRARTPGVYPEIITAPPYPPRAPDTETEEA